jgi:hypothetical protein
MSRAAALTSLRKISASIDGARGMLSSSHQQEIPHPMTHGGKSRLSRGFRPRLQGPGGRRCKVVADVLQVQALDIAAQSAFCNAATLATPSLTSCAHTRGRVHGGAWAGPCVIARACAVATVAVLHNRELIEISITWYGSNLQQPCNACNTGHQMAGHDLPATTCQAIDYGRIIASGELDAGHDGQSAGGDERAAGGWPAGPAARQTGVDRGGEVGFDLVGLHLVGSMPGPMISMGYEAGTSPDTRKPDTRGQNAQQYQWLDAASTLVQSTSAEASPTGWAGPFGETDSPPPSPRAPTPKPRPRPLSPPAWPCVFPVLTENTPRSSGWSGSARAWGPGLPSRAGGGVRAAAEVRGWPASLAGRSGAGVWAREVRP